MNTFFCVHLRPSFAGVWCIVRRIVLTFTSWPVTPTSSRTYASPWQPPVTPAWPWPPPPTPLTAAPQTESPAHPRLFWLEQSVWGVFAPPLSAVHRKGVSNPLPANWGSSRNWVREGWRWDASPSTLLPLPGIWRVVLVFILFYFSDGRGLKAPHIEWARGIQYKAVLSVRRTELQQLRLVEETGICPAPHTCTYIHTHTHTFMMRPAWFFLQ